MLLFQYICYCRCIVYLLSTGCLLYTGMRHEILNETDKHSVYHDIINWIEKHL